MIHGAKDVITNPQDSIRFYRKIASEDKNIKVFDEGYHQLHDDNESLNLQKYICEWCKQRSIKSLSFSINIFYIYL